jgi:hypothetical protein
MKFVLRKLPQVLQQLLAERWSTVQQLYPLVRKMFTEDHRCHNLGNTHRILLTERHNGGNAMFRQNLDEGFSTVWLTADEVVLAFILAKMCGSAGNISLHTIRLLTTSRRSSQLDEGH